MYTPSVSIINYIFIHIILNVYNVIICRSSFYLTYDTTTLHTIKETTQDTLDDSTRILHQATISYQKSTVLIVGQRELSSWGS